MTAPVLAVLAIIAWIGVLILILAMCRASADADRVAHEIFCSQAGTESSAAVDDSQDAMTPTQTTDGCCGRAAGPPDTPSGRGR